MSLPDADPEPSDDGVVAFRRRGVTIGEAYFSAAAADAPGLSRIDLLRIVAAFSPPSERGARKRHTLVIDLDDDEDRLFEQMSKDTRSKIRRAMQKDPLEVTAAAEPSAAQVDEFADFYDRFAAAQSVAPAFRPRLHALAEGGNLVLSGAVGEDGEVLVRHAYVAARGRGYMLYSGRSGGVRRQRRAQPHRAREPLSALERHPPLQGAWVRPLRLRWPRRRRAQPQDRRHRALQAGLRRGGSAGLLDDERSLAPGAAVRRILALRGVDF